MNILINLATLKKGGGQNVGLNFVTSLNELEFKDISFIYAVARHSELEKNLKGRANNLIILPSSPMKRMLFEIKNGRKIIEKFDVHIVYTYFGIGLYPANIPQVSGSADSNLYFPEIDFWSEYKGVQRLKRNIVDFYRKWGIRRATAIVFENASMKARCESIFKKRNTRLILPSINMEYPSEKLSMPNSVPSSVQKGLFFCGWQRNKNFMLIPEIAFLLKKDNIPFHFVFTAEDDNSVDSINFIKKLNEYDVLSMVTMIGKVNKSKIKSLYEQVDFVFLLSKLESFSNNIIEAWSFRKPLIVSDALWSKAICGEAAIYVDRNDAKEISMTISACMASKKLRLEIIDKGRRKLQLYPSIKERTIEEIKFLRDVYESN